MMPFSQQIKLTEDEQRFLIDNKNSAWMNLMKKVLAVIADEFEYKESLYSEDITTERMLILKGNRLGLLKVYNFLNFYSQEKPKEKELAQPRLIK